jgi:hypothetical protein
MYLDMNLIYLFIGTHTANLEMKTPRLIYDTIKCSRMETHQEKPHLLICGNKYGSALISREQTNFD